VAGADGQPILTAHEIALAQAHGRRLAETALKLTGVR
jgi:hypothetical protein